LRPGPPATRRLLLGLALIVLFAVFEKRYNDLRLVERLRNLG
jgi:hypothetical protein